MTGSSTMVVPAWQGLVNGAVGGVGLTLAGHPADLVKVRVQTSNLYSSAWQCARSTVKRDGMLGMYRGVSAPLLATVPMCQACFFGYEVGRSAVLAAKGGSSGVPLSSRECAAAGAISGAVTTLVTVPADRVKVLLQIQGQQGGGGAAAAARYSGPFDCARSLVRQGGLRSLYRGTAVTFLRDVPGYATYFFFYETTKAALMPTEPDAPMWRTVAAIFTAGAAAGVTNWIAICPMDVIKSRIQTSEVRAGVTKVARELSLEGGARAFYKGIGPSVARAIPANAACMAGVELSKSIFRQLDLC